MFALNTGEDPVHCHTASPFQTRIHCCQWNLQIGGFLNIVKPDDLHLIRDSYACRRQRGDNADGELIIKCDNTVKRYAGFDYPPHCPRSGSDSPILSGNTNQIEIQLAVSFPASIDNSPQAQLGVPLLSMG